jgi:hypothetical protein
MPQKHKGDRDQITARPPIDVGRILRARAIRAGVPTDVLVSAILSEYVGLSHLAPMPNIDHINPQQEFDLPRTA